jgi:hypothetical protein
MEFDDWSAFTHLLEELSLQSKKGKEDAELISPALYIKDSTRANRNVESWAGWCAVDVDDFNVIQEDNLHNVIRNAVGEYNFVCYSTASSTPINPKFRLVFPINRHVLADEIPSFWFALNQQLGEIGDVQTKDRSRMYYIPANYDNAFNFFFANDGTDIDPDQLIARHPYKEKGGESFFDRLPPELQDAVIAHRKQQMSNTTTVWSDYRDCPFFPKRLANEYTSLSNSGWYHKMFQIMVATAGNAIKNDYPITAKQIAELCKQLDNDTGKWYNNRPLELEADRAVEYAYKNS